MAKFIFITGGVVSSLGKGITTASIGAILKSMGYTVALKKLDPYLNIDPGTMNPAEHGEVFVTNDGIEADLDLGHYERFTNILTSRESSVTSGKIYQQLIQNERNGVYLGKTVQTIPHVTDLISQFITNNPKKVDFILCEIGGTVGDIEALPFFETIRQIRQKHKNKTMLFHLTYVPYLATSREIKTKPTQHSVKELMSIGLLPDALVCRSSVHIGKENRKKIALFCNVKQEAVIEAMDASTIYEVPLLMLREKLDLICLKKLNINGYGAPNLDKWNGFLQKLKNPKSEVRIGLIGKYIELQDAYKSILESFIHAGAPNEVKVKVVNVHSEHITQDNVAQKLEGLDGLLVAPGFGNRGIEGKIHAVQYARENNLPFFGICLGMQMSVIEYARNVLGLADAHSTEMNATTSNPVINMMEEQKKIKMMGGTMRLGAYPCEITPGSLAHKIYGATSITERHRHRYEFNNDYYDAFIKAGLVASGKNPETGLVEIVELPNHPFFIGVQYHPELKSTAEVPAPLFVSFLAAAKLYQASKAAK